MPGLSILSSRFYLAMLPAIQSELYFDRFLVWCYVPNYNLTGWELPYVVENSCPSLADAHHHARTLRMHYPGHLFAVTNGNRPNSTVSK